MVFTRRNLRQLDSQPEQNTAAWVQQLATIVEQLRETQESLPSLPSVPNTQESNVSNEHEFEEFDVDDLMDWFEQATPEQRNVIRQWIKRYRPNDTVHRHRLNDDQPKDEIVHTYRRRRA